MHCKILLSILREIFESISSRISQKFSEGLSEGIAGTIWIKIPGVFKQESIEGFRKWAICEISEGISQWISEGTCLWNNLW